MARYEDPDRALARWLTEADERFCRQERAERIDDYTPRGELGAVEGSAGEGGRITSAMQVLAHTVLNGSFADARDAARVLAELVLEAGE